MEMEDQYNMSDLRHLMNGGGGGGRIHFPSIPLQPATELFPSHRGGPPPPPPPHPYEQLMMMGRPQAHEMISRGLHHSEFRSPDSAGGGTSCNNNTSTVTAAPSLSGGGLEAEAGGCLGGEGSGRWPRQETLTLLEIRSRLDFKFKEANQKGPLWDEVSRIMCEEHGYQRSGKKCREKFENLYKYYKKTKEGKAGRQDGKHYRFFRQLEALYGETTNAAVVSPPIPPPADQPHFIANASNPRYQTPTNNTHLPSQENTNNATHQHHRPYNQKHCESLSLSNSSEFETTSSEDQDNEVAKMDEENSTIMMRRRRSGGSGGGQGWKGKIKEFIDVQMRKLMEKQEEWLERLMSTLEHKERERMVREEEWRKQEVERVEREHKFWAKERAWIEARDKALMEALHRLNGGSSSSPANQPHHEIAHPHNKEMLSKKRKENTNSRSEGCYFSSNNNNNESCSSMYTSSQGGYCGEMNDHDGNHHQGGGCGGGGGSGGNNNDHGSNSPCGNANVGSNHPVHHDHNCFPFLIGEGENLWENYELKLTKGTQNQ